METVELPSGGDLDKWLALNERYHKKRPQEKEAFAHRYADDFRQRKLAERRIPFEQVADAEQRKQQGLDPEWFVAPPAE